MGYIGHKNKKSLHQQVYDVLQNKAAFGKSKHSDKLTGENKGRIYSFNTLRTYLKHCHYFVNWLKESEEVKNVLGRKPRTLQECQQFVESFIRYQEQRGLSAYTVKMEKAALSKLYGCEFDFETIATRRQNIKRSRQTGLTCDKHFSEKNNADMVNACRCIGFRRSELVKAKPQDLHQIEGEWWIDITGKGGRFRRVKLYGTPEEIESAVKYVKGLTGNNHVHENADIHGYRAEYAARVYNYHAKDLKELRGQKVDYTALTGKRKADGSRIKKSAVYWCRTDKSGTAYDRAALIVASQMLGHNRESVVAGHYLHFAGESLGA